MNIGCALLAFLSVFLLDIFWVYYTRGIVERKRLSAANWAVAIGICSGTLTLSLIQSGWYLIPSLLGAWCGTFVAVGLKHGDNVGRAS